MLSHLGNIAKELRKNRVLFLMLVPTIAFFIVFHYLVMPGVYIAFVDYKMNKGIFGSTFVGFKNFRFLIQNGDLWRITRNTLLYNAVFLLLGNLVQIAFAVMLSEIYNKLFKRLTQSILLLPHFMSMVIVGVFAYNLFSYDFGFINSALVSLGLDKFDFYSNQGIWKYIIVFFKLWSGTGYGMIIYLAAISGINTEVYEAAYIDGAGLIQRIRHITVPLLKTTFVLMILFRLGDILRGSFDLFYNLIGNNSVLFPQTDIIDTYVFRGLVGQFNFSMSAAVGFYQSLFGLVIVLVANFAVRKVEPESALF